MINSNFAPNPILRTDSYKMTHFDMLPDGTEYVSAYVEARKGDYPVTFVGLQAFIRQYLLTPITKEDVEEAEAMCTEHVGKFNKEGYMYIVEEHGGYLPVRIEALPEGTVVPIGVPMIKIINTDPKCPWVVSPIETALLRSIWYASTVSTISRVCKELFVETLNNERYSPEDTISIANFMLQDFGARGVSSSESAGIGGFGHLVNFMGTDTMEAIEFAQQFYNCIDMPAFSVEATEHSVVTSWGEDGEVDMYRKMIQGATAKGSIVSIVSDSYDIDNAVLNIYGDILKDDIIKLGEAGGKLVVRPDSGHPVLTPVQVVLDLIKNFGYTSNAAGYKVLPPYLRVLQGDGIDLEDIREIIKLAHAHELSLENFIFGMGGGLLQKVNRDTFGFAMKVSARYDGKVWHDVYKLAPNKKSKRGVLDVISVDGVLTCVRKDDIKDTSYSELVDVYRNGKLLVEVSLDDLRARAVR